MHKIPPLSRQVKYLAALVAGLVLAGCDGGAGNTLPDGVTGDDVVQFKSAVTAVGCTISTSVQAADVMAQTGFNDEKLHTITQYLTLAGESEPVTAGFRLTSGSCANA